ncbi:MAG TPA: urease accessory protein UreD [Microvirga sp.]
MRVAIRPTPRGSAPFTVAESGGYRVRFTGSPAVCEGVLINTGGGMTGGDVLQLRCDLGEAAEAVLTTQAAEKIYRSDGPETEISIDLTLAARSRLAWLPQEQILFDGARLRRTLGASLAHDAALTLVESTVLGRHAMGETLRSGLLRDRWRIRRGGRLVLAEEVRLEGDMTQALARKALGGGARATATFLHIEPDAERMLEPARALLAGSKSETGTTAFDGMLVARFLSPDPHVLRTELARFLEGFLRRPLPRSWQT